MLSGTHLIGLSVIAVLFVVGNLLPLLVSKIAASKTAQQSPAEPAKAERTAGEVLDCLKGVTEWMREHTDVADAQLQPLETLVPFLLHEPKPKTGA